MHVYLCLKGNLVTQWSCCFDCQYCEDKVTTAYKRMHLAFKGKASFLHIRQKRDSRGRMKFCWLVTNDSHTDMMALTLPVHTGFGGICEWRETQCVVVVQKAPCKQTASSDFINKWNTCRNATCWISCKSQFTWKGVNGARITYVLPCSAQAVGLFKDHSTEASVMLGYEEMPQLARQLELTTWWITVKAKNEDLMIWILKSVCKSAWAGMHLLSYRTAQSHRKSRLAH